MEVKALKNYQTNQAYIDGNINVVTEEMIPNDISFDPTQQFIAARVDTLEFGENGEPVYINPSEESKEFSPVVSSRPKPIK